MSCQCRGSCRCNNYGCGSFIFDVFMTCITAGFWLIWVFCRELRKRRC